MSKIFKHVLSLAMAVLMMVPVVGSFAVNAAETQKETTKKETTTIYFLNNQQWATVNAYTWSDSNTQKAAFPGVKLEAVGTIDYMYDGVYEVFALEVDEDDDHVIFSYGNVEGVQSSPVDLRNMWGGYNIISLDENNTSIVGHFFDPSTIKEFQKPSESIDYTKKLYFINNKNWENVYAYTYKYIDEKGPKDESNVLKDKDFPGEKLESVGKIKWWNEETRSYEMKDVYEVNDLGADDDYIIFSQGFDHGQESKPILIKYKWGGYNVVSLDANNIGTLGHFFNPNDIVPNEK